jgi:hypothetical protein
MSMRVSRVPPPPPAHPLIIDFDCVGAWHINKTERLIPRRSRRPRRPSQALALAPTPALQE